MGGEPGMIPRKNSRVMESGDIFLGGLLAPPGNLSMAKEQLLATISSAITMGSSKPAISSNSINNQSQREHALPKPYPT